MSVMDIRADERPDTEIAAILINHPGNEIIRTVVYKDGSAHIRRADELGHLSNAQVVPAWWGRIRYARALREGR